MIRFSQKKIANINTLGEKLKDHRELNNLTLDQVSKITKINIQYLMALEDDNFKKLPSEIYVKNFLRSYAKLLNLNEEVVIADFLKSKKIIANKKPHSLTPVVKKKKLSVFSILLSPQAIKIAIICLIFLITLGYFGYNVNKIFAAPTLNISNPPDNLITKEKSITIEGQTVKEADLTINGQPILSDRNGFFQAKVILSKGLNIIRISAQKKYSKENIIYKQVIVEEEEVKEPIPN